MDGDGGSFSLTDEFSGEIADASIQEVTVDGSTVDPFFADADNTTAVVTLQDTGANAQVEVTYEVVASSNTGAITINGSATGGQTIQLGEEQVQVQQPTTQVGLSNVNLSPNAVEGGTTNPHTLTFDATDVSDDGNTDSFTVEIPAAATLESADSLSVTDSNGDSVALSGGPSVSGNTITFDVSPDSSADTRDLTVTADVTVTAPDVSSTTQADIGIDVSDSENGQDSAAATLTINPEGTETITSDDYDATVESGQLRWEGQELFFQASDTDGEYAVYSTESTENGRAIDTFQTQLPINANGAVTFDTSDFGSGYFVIVKGSNTAVETDGSGQEVATGTTRSFIDNAAFQVAPQSISTAEFDDAEVTDTDSTTLELRSNRAQFTVNVTAEGLSGEDLVDILEADTNIAIVNDDDDVAQFDVTSRTSYDANFTGIDAGDYDFNFDVIDTTATASTAITVTDVDREAEFGDIETDERGDIVEIPVEISGDDQAVVSLGSDDDGYLNNVTVTDGDDDGQVTIEWNTYRAGTGQNVFSVSDSDDSVSAMLNTEATDVTGGPNFIVSQGSYDLEATAGDNPAEEADDLAQLTLEERSTDSVQHWTAPDSVIEDVRDADDNEGALSEITGAVESGTLTQDSSVATGDVSDLLVVQIDASGLEGALAGAYDSDDADNTAAIKAGLNAELISLEHNEVITGSSNQAPTEIDAANVAANNMVFVPNFESDTHYVIYDAGDLPVEDGETYTTEFSVLSEDSDENEYWNNQANFGLVAPNDDDEFEDETVEANFNVQDAEVTLDTADSGNVELRTEDGQTVSGTTTLAAGTDLRLRLQTVSGAAQSFIITPEPTVQAGENMNTFSTSVNMSGYSEGIEFDVRVRKGQTRLASEDGMLVGPASVDSLEFNDQESGGEVVRIASAELSAGGFIAIHEGSATGDVVGASSYLQEGQSYSDVAVVLEESYEGDQTLVAMPHLDTDGDQTYDFVTSDGADDGPYVSGGSAVTQSATVTFPGADTATPEPDTPTPTPEPDTPTPTMDGGDGGDGTATQTPAEEGPGFGAIVAILGLLGAALLAVRRNE